MRSQTTLWPAVFIMVTTALTLSAELIAQEISPQKRVNPLIQAPTNKSFNSTISERTEVKNTTDAERRDWLKTTKQKLRQFQPAAETPRAIIKPYTFDLFYWIEHEGLIEFENDEWLYIVTHSSHAKDNVGNVILAIDHAGNLYENQAHVCGKISVYAADGKAFERVSDFIDARVNHDYEWSKH